MKVSQKRVKELLAEWETAKAKVDGLTVQQEAATKEIREKADKQIAKAIAPFSDDFNNAHADMTRFAFEIETEMQKGFDGENFAVTKVEFGNVFVEVKTTESREVSVETWLKEVPKGEQNGKFFETLKVMIGKAEKLRSDLVNKFATLKRSHTISIKVKQTVNN
jgi:molecular chaperone GrpE (heat shock protein)